MTTFVLAEALAVAVAFAVVVAVAVYAPLPGLLVREEAALERIITDTAGLCGERSGSCAVRLPAPPRRKFGELQMPSKRRKEEFIFRLLRVRCHVGSAAGPAHMTSRPTLSCACPLVLSCAALDRWIRGDFATVRDMASQALRKVLRISSTASLSSCSDWARR